MSARWTVLQSPEHKHWFRVALSDPERDAIIAAIVRLQHDGPAMRRPLSGAINGSRFSNMKEWIPPGGNIRILYIFDPERRAILLLGGDKTNDWRGWYPRNIPIADQIYERHLAEMRKRRSDSAGGPTARGSR